MLVGVGILVGELDGLDGLDVSFIKIILSIP
jgi:hypothetical protein